MKIMTLAPNIVLLLFTCFIIATDGPPDAVSHNMFILWTFLILIFNLIVISHNKANKKIEPAVIIGNIILLGFICYALIDEYPHPAEAGFIEFMVLIVLTPIFSLIMFLRSYNIYNDLKSKNIY